MRKLVTLQKISKISPIQGADNIELARVLGWAVVVKKGEFKEGDTIVYAETDSVFPEREEFEFLRRNKFRVRTIEIRKQVSQGLILPISVLPNGKYSIGDDLTDILGVIKYEPEIPASLNGETLGPFPSFIQKSDETRVQLLQEELTKFKGVRCVYSEKLEGASFTAYYRDGKFGVCSRNLELKEDYNNTYWQIARDYNLKEKLGKLGRNIAIQGEIVGDKIQGNPYKFKKNERKLFVYNIFDINNYLYLDYQNFSNLMMELKLDSVPFLESEFMLIDNIDQLVELSKGDSLLAENVKREGIVIKVYGGYENMANRFSFKVINPEYLLENKM